MGCFNSKVQVELLQINHHNVGTLPVLHAHCAAESSRSIQSASLHIQGDSDQSIKTLTFKHVMGDKLGREYFMKFLEFEHAEENLAFFQDVEDIKLNTGDELRRSMVNIVDLYLKPGVETEVNISDNMKKNILVLANCEEGMDRAADLIKCLEKAQNEILMIMGMGAFPRFMKSQLFRDYKRKAHERDAKNETIRGAEPISE